MEFLSTSSKKKRKIRPEKNSYISGNGPFLLQKNLMKTKLFTLTLDKAPSGETGCLSKLYYLLTAQESSFLIHHSFPNTVS